MIKYVFLFFPQPKQAPNQTDTQCVHQKFKAACTAYEQDTPCRHSNNAECTTPRGLCSA